MTDKDEVLRMFDSGATVNMIANELEMSETSVRHLLTENGRTLARRRGSKDEDVIVEKYLEGRSIPEILTEEGISYPTLYAILKRKNIPLRKTERREGSDAATIQALELYKAGVPLWQITRDTGVQQPALHTAVHNAGIPLRRPRNARTIPTES